MVCATCNNGWLGSLEGAAKPVIAPLIHGEPRRLRFDDQALIAAWACKTALMSLLVSNEAGPGVPPGEYTSLYAQRDRMEPLPFSQYWIGSYTGEGRASSIWVTPFVIEGPDTETPPDFPTGYAMILTLGRLLVKGVRFTQPALQVDLATEWGLLGIWPAADTFPWPLSGGADDAALDRTHRLQTFVSQVPGLRLSPFKPAVQLPASTLDGELIRLPLCCGKHDASYPVKLALDTLRTGRHYTFLVSCECPMGYIIRTEADGAHMKRWGAPEAVEAAFEEWPGKEFAIEAETGTFRFKEE